MSNDDRKQDYLDDLRERGLLTKSARALSISMATIARWRKDDEQFEEGVQLALLEHAEKLEEEAVRRAHDGVEEPVFHKGEVVGYVTKYSDSLMSKLLDGAMPNKYGSRSKVELTGAGGGPIAVDDTTTAAKLAMIIAAARERKAAEEASDADNDPLFD